MSFFNVFIAALSAAAGYYTLQILDTPASRILAAAFGVFGCYVLTLSPSERKRRAIVKLRGLSWTREDFCRGWLITGDTGSGKTRSGITPLLYQVFKNEPGWGGVCIDDKGLYWETLSEMAAHFNRQNDLILLQVKPDNAPSGWAPQHTYNLTSDRSIPASTYAKFVVDTASSLGQQGDKGFFKKHTCVLVHAERGFKRTQLPPIDPNGKVCSWFGKG